MDFEKFVKKVKDGAQAYLGDGVSLSVSTVLKNNGVNLTGIIFMDGDSDVASTIYLDGLYEEYKRGWGKLSARYVRFMRKINRNRT